MPNDSVTAFIAELGARPATITARISHHSGCYGGIDALKNQGILPFASVPSLFFCGIISKNSQPLRPVHCPTRCVSCTGRDLMALSETLGRIRGAGTVPCALRGLASRGASG